MTRLGDSKTGSWLTGRNPYIFQDKYDQSLHIFRTFKTVLNAEIIDELYWISQGGILYISVQPEPWGHYVEIGGSTYAQEEIVEIAQAIKAIEPYQVFFSVGYEPDLYIAETLGDDAVEIKGTTYEYVAMWANFVRIFKE